MCRDCGFKLESLVLSDFEVTQEDLLLASQPEGTVTVTQATVTVTQAPTPSRPGLGVRDGDSGSESRDRW